MTPAVGFEIANPTLARTRQTSEMPWHFRDAPPVTTPVRRTTVLPPSLDAAPPGSPVDVFGDRGTFQISQNIASLTESESRAQRLPGFLCQSNLAESQQIDGGHIPSGPRQPLFSGISSGLLPSLVPPYIPLIKCMISRGDVRGARKFLALISKVLPLDQIPSSLTAVLSSPKTSLGSLKDKSRTSEHAWIRANASHFKGQWVALDGNELLGCATTLRSLRLLLRDKADERQLLIYHFAVGEELDPHETK